MTVRIVKIHTENITVPQAYFLQGNQLLKTLVYTPGQQMSCWAEEVLNEVQKIIDIQLDVSLLTAEDLNCFYMVLNQCEEEVDITFRLPEETEIIDPAVRDDITRYLEQDFYVMNACCEAAMPMASAPPKQKSRTKKMFGMRKMSLLENCNLELPFEPLEETFQRKLLKLIDETGETDPQVYKRANIDRKLFAKIRKDENYKPSRKTALAFTIALRLNVARAEDLLESAGFAFSRADRRDMIVQYCLEHEIYDIYEVNKILFEFDQPTL